MKRKETNVVVVTTAIFIATFMTAIEGTIVSTAMPTIVGSLHGLSIMNWVFSIYLLTNAMMTPIYGKLADRIGRKPVFIVGILIFIIGSSLCGLAQNMIQLIIFRAIQGIGAGAILPVALTIIADIYPIEKRAKILGLNNAAWGIASVVGPLFGGFIVDAFSWHWIFLINVPIGIVLIGLIMVYLVEPKVEKQKSSVDILGSLSLMGVLLTLLYGFQSLGGTNGFQWQTVVYFVLAIGLFIGFIYVEKRAEDPVISLDLFKDKTFIVVNLVAALVSGFLMGVEVYIPMWMQGILGMKAALGGLALAPMSITWILGSFLAGKLMTKYVMKHTLFLGLILILFGATFLALTPMATPYWVFLVVSPVLGVGMGLTITTTTVQAQSTVKKEMLGVATSFNTLARTVGQTIMISVFGVVLNGRMNAQLAAHPNGNIDQDMLNQLVNPHTAGSLPVESLKPLKNILYNGLHSVYMVGVVLILVALIVNQLQKKESL